MAIRSRNKPQGDGVNIDWAAVNAQVEEDTHDCRPSLIVDLGTQKRTDAVYHEGKEDYTYVASEEELDAILDRAEELKGEYLMNKDDLYGVEDVEIDSDKVLEDVKANGVPKAKMGDTVHQVGFRIASRKDADEVAYFVDLVDTYVEYVEGEEAKQYRVMLNGTDFKTRELQGFALTEVPPMKKGGVWTYHVNSTHAKLAKACGVYDEMIDAGNDVSVMLDQPCTVEISKNDKGFIKVGNLGKLKKKELDAGITELDCEPQVIEFETCTVEQLKEAKLRKAVLDKIKQATNYEGSQIQKAIEEFESGFNKPESTSKADKEESNTNVGGEDESDPTSTEEDSEPPKEDKPAKRGRKASKPAEEEETKPKRRGRKPKVTEPEPEEEDEDNPPW